MSFETGKVANPFGRPTGAKNKSTKEIKERLQELCIDNLDKFKDDLSVLEPKFRAKYLLELFKHLVPRPIFDGEETTDVIKNEFIKRLFNIEDKDL
jgi:hypothetical protein